jgi:hypothetical protein
MRAFLSLLCSPMCHSAPLVAAGREANKSDVVEYYRTVLAEIAADGSSSMRLPVDLPEPIHEAIDAWRKAADLHTQPTAA